MTAERVIHAAVFALLLVGLCAVAGWVSLQIEDLILKIAGIAISWGVILLVLYVAFRKLRWQWWNSTQF